jgi:putative salt-induced outer membrane protein YdiY
MSIAYRILCASLITLLSTTAFAADPKYEYKDPTAPPPPVTEKHTIWKANMQLGLVWVAGNAESLGFSAAALVGVKHWNNEFTLSGGGAYVSSGVSKYGTGGPITDNMTSAANWIVKGRYDRYFLEKNTVFVSFQSSGDKPAGYVYRLEPQAGYARLFFKSPRQLFKGELGYDYTYQHNGNRATPPNIDYHSARLFLFYENKFTPYAGFSESLEMLEAFNHAEAFRLNSITSLSSTIWKNVSLKLNFTLKFFNDPPSRPNTLIDPATGVAPVLRADQTHFDKVDTQLDLVLAVTFL